MSENQEEQPQPLDTVNEAIDAVLYAMESGNWDLWTLTPRLFLGKPRLNSDNKSTHWKATYSHSANPNSTLPIMNPQRYTRVSLTRSCFLKCPPKRLNCDICLKPYSSNAKLKFHKYTHMTRDELTEQKVHFLTCPKCNHICYQKYYFDKHLAGHDQEVACSICPAEQRRVFAHPSMLRNHLFDHLSCREEGFKVIKLGGVPARKKCPLCLKLFTTYHELNAHLINGHPDRFQTRIPPRKRSINRKPTKRPAAVPRPRATDATHICTVSTCGKAFKSKFDLKEHLKIHVTLLKSKTAKQSTVTTTAPVEIKCKECAKTFKDNNELERHRRIVHVGLKIFQKKLQRNFPCGVCKIKFPLKSKLVTHMLQVHKKKPQ